MSIYGDQVGRRVKNDDEKIEKSLRLLEDAVTGHPSTGWEEDAAEYGDDPQMSLILGYFHLMEPTGVMKRKVFLEDEWWEDGFGPMLAILKSTSQAVALLPEDSGGYCFYDTDGGSKTKVTKDNHDLFEPDAWCFYKPLPDEAISKKEYISLILKECRPPDVFSVAAAAIAIAAVNMLIPFATMYAYNNLVPSGKAALLIPLACMLMSAAISSWLFSAVRLSVTERITTKMEILIQNAVFARVLYLPAAFFKDKSSGGLARRVAALISAPKMLCDILFGGILTLAASVIYIAQIGMLAGVLAVPALIVFVVMIAFYALTILQEQKRIKLKLAAEERNHGVTYSMVSGIQKIKVSGSEKRAFARWLEGYAIQSKADYTIYVPFAFRDQILATISCIGTLCFYYITYRNQLSVAQFTAFISAFGLVSGAISAMGSIGSSFSNLKPALDMGEDILQTLPECTQDLTKVEKITGRVELNEVSFRYSQDTPLILDAVSLLIQPGEYVALVGKSGCGKSTIMKLLLGFEQPVQGTVSLDGTDINKLDLRSMRSHIGTVMQDRRLFSGDILTNITIADRRLTIDDAWAAAEKAGIAEDIRNMPMGMHTHIGENGEGVSGGQKQRILIARAIAPDPGLLLFDEATSALDNISQNVVTDTLSRMKGTRIVIAHRLSTIKECDRIIAIDQGHIVEEGTYDELMSKKGFFAELVERQQRSDME